MKPKKNPHRVESYRPISLISHLRWTLETVINKRITFHLECDSLYSKTQSGFRSTRCAIGKVIRLEEQVKQGCKKGDKTIAGFLDLKKKTYY